MNLSGDKNEEVKSELTLAEQGITAESVLALDIRPGASYTIQVFIGGEGDTMIQLPYSFNDSIEKLRQAVSEVIQLPLTKLTLLYK